MLLATATTDHTTTLHTRRAEHTAVCATCGPLNHPQPGTLGLAFAAEVAEVHELLRPGGHL